MSSNYIKNWKRKTRNPDVLAFHKSLPHYHPTPLVALPALAQQLGIKHLLLKDESSRLGLPAFKMLGASYATVRVLSRRLRFEENGLPVTSIDELGPAAQQEKLTLYAATDGNHGRAVARMAKYLGIRARIYIPRMLDEEAKSKIASEGAEVEAAESHDDKTGVLISDTALDESDDTARYIVEGYQTMFDEIEEQIAELDATSNITHVVAPVGVGSLAQAVVTHFGQYIKSSLPAIITVEPESAACLKKSLEEGQMVTVAAENTICSGMCCGTLSAIAWPLLKAGVHVATVVRDIDVDQAVNELSQYGVQAGPCGAASLAGLMDLAKSGTLTFGSEDVVIVLCTEGKRGYQLQA